MDLQGRRELQQLFQWDRSMKFIKHVTVNTPSREKTLQWISTCWRYQPLPPVIYIPESTFQLGMNYGDKWLSLLWSLWMLSSHCMYEQCFSNCYIDYKCCQAIKLITNLIWMFALLVKLLSNQGWIPLPGLCRNLPTADMGAVWVLLTQSFISNIE